MINLDGKEYEIKGTTKCECGEEYSLEQVNEIKKINQKGFYGNILNNYSEITCKKCKKRCIIFLKQKGQTWDIIDSATEIIKQQEKPEEIKEDVAEQPKTVIEQNNNKSNELICPICKKACKSKIGLNAHLKTHEN